MDVFANETPLQAFSRNHILRKNGLDKRSLLPGFISEIITYGDLKMASFVAMKGNASRTPQNKFTLSIWIDGTMIWKAIEPDGTSNIFNTKKGVWMRAVNIVTLFQDDAVTKVAQLMPLIPDKAQPGDAGHGQSFETAVDFDWTVLP